ncbi:pH-inducible protein involved in stress response (putative kinase) [Escherichia coli]|uniref:pH-inducible protein involved in stress response (Putative kinase) n=1 Tax=Escherichia coli TaxID=562 RepID=A0A376TCN1_ECOLX|nr:pH-inducible protein involved in stress response (putative kinase) [Escherichia coli]
MHSINRQHGCCYVRHIYVKTEGNAEAGFLDLEKSRRRLRRDKAINHDFRQLEKYLEPIPKADWEAGESVLLRHVIVVGQIRRISVVSGTTTNSHLDFNIAFCPATTGQNFPRLNKG